MAWYLLEFVTHENKGLEIILCGKIEVKSENKISGQRYITVCKLANTDGSFIFHVAYTH